MSDQQRNTAGGRQRSSRELRAEIEETRARLSRDIDAARTKFSRRGLQHEAMSALQGVRQESRGAIENMGDGAQRQVSQFGGVVVDAVKRYSVISTLVGVGLALVAFTSTRRSDRRTEHVATPDGTRELPEPRSESYDEFAPTSPTSGSRSTP